jgi:nitrite reductase (NADH) large subunit
VLVGDASSYDHFVDLYRREQTIPEAAEQLLLEGAPSATDLGDEAQICSCNQVSKADICNAIRDEDATSVAAIRSCTRAGSGCGGCAPLVGDILSAELAASGKSVRPRLCEHFEQTRQELFHIVQATGIRTFDALLSQYGSGQGCEICKPTVASILASVWNDNVLNHQNIQDTNDRFLANIQRGGLYSVVPRVPGGEITPQKLIALGSIAQKYGLYTKITGGQRIDLFGARVDQLPDIWEELVEAGFESGHAYGKAVRTVKSCVGSTWCRYGVQDSVGFAIRVEERYKGIRAPHKLKSAVSGCTRECAEAQSKDFGLIATDKGYNVYVCGNGGMRPRHADLLAADVDEDTALRYLDRFLAFYIRTADKLTRTSVWLEKMDGGIEYLRDVVVNDKLGIADDLERHMQHLVDTYQCEWAAVVRDPEKRARFRHFARSQAVDTTIELVDERGQRRPADWARDRVNGDAPRTRPPTNGVNGANGKRHLPTVSSQWVRVGQTHDFPKDSGVTVRHGDAQIAVFNFASRGEWYAIQNVCPHKRDMVLARGMLGSEAGTPKVACPMHKKTFALTDGRGLSDEGMSVATFPVRVDDGAVYVDVSNARALKACAKPAECDSERAHAPAPLLAEPFAEGPAE